MPNLSEFPVGASLLDDLGGIYSLEKYINIHTVLASESGIGGGIPGIPDTAHLPGVCFRFDGSGRVNYCKILLAKPESIHIELRDLQRLPDEQVITVEKFVARDFLKDAFSYLIGFQLPGCELWSDQES